MCEEIALQYGVVVVLKQFNYILLEPGTNVSPSLKEMEGFVNVFKYTNSVCALVFNLEDDVDETENHIAFINAVVIEMRNRIA